MTSAEQIFERVRQAGGRVTLSGGRVRCRLPDTSEGHDLAEALRQNRDAVMEQLRAIELQASASGLARWQRDFEYWRRERCRFVDNYWSPTRDLHSDFIGWNIHRDCDLPTFSALLDGIGVDVKEQRVVEWCYGLVLTRLLPPELAEARRPRALVDGRLEEG